MPGPNLIFYGTTGQPGTADGQSQPNPALYLGDFRASQVLHSLQSTLTSSQTAQSRHYVVDSSQIGAGANVHALKWLAMVTGPAAVAAARVERFDTLTGTYKLDRPLPASAASGNTYRLFTRGNVWPNVSAAQAAIGDRRYRCIVFRNEHAGAIASVKIFFRDLSAGAADCHRFHQAQQQTGIAFLNRADDVTDPLDVLGQIAPLGGPNSFTSGTGSGGWQNPFGRATANELVVTLNQNEQIAIWLRRTIPAGVGLRRSVAIQLIAESTTTGSDPSPLAVSVLMPFDIATDAAAPEAEIEPDRYVHIAGGARLRARVTRGAGPEANRAVRWALRIGDPGSLATNDAPTAGLDTTEADGDTFATYRAPADPALEGESAHPQLVLEAGDELGDPQPRTSLAGTSFFAFTTTGDLNQPSAQRTEDEDPAPGFWPGL